jgi:hypothetical protein
MVALSSYFFNYTEVWLDKHSKIWPQKLLLREGGAFCLFKTCPTQGLRAQVSCGALLDRPPVVALTMLVEILYRAGLFVPWGGVRWKYSLQPLTAERR